MLPHSHEELKMVIIDHSLMSMSMSMSLDDRRREEKVVVVVDEVLVL